MSIRAFSPNGHYSTLGKMRREVSVHPANIRNHYRKPIPWYPTTEGLLLSRFSAMEYPFRNHFLKIADLGELGSEIKRFLICLDAYIESENYLQDSKDILYYAAAGPRGSDIQKRIKRASIFKTFMTSPYERDEELEDIPAYIFKDIGQIFNYNYLPFWEEEVDDYKYGFLPVNQTDRMLVKFRDVIRDILPDDVSVINKREILLESSGSGCLVKERNGIFKKSKKFLQKQFTNDFSKSIGTCLRTVVPVGPQSWRDTVMLTTNASNKVTYIDRQLMEVLKKLPMHIHLKSNRDIRRRISKFGKKYHFFVHRDMKKEGITKPRTLLKIMLEELNRKYPEMEAFHDTDFYEDFQLMVDHEIKSPERGHGLGMANSLTTLMNIAIYLISIGLDDDDLEPIQEEASSLSLNDDFVAGFETEEDSYAYQDRELRVMTELDILFAPKKSFCSYEKFVIAEEYWPRPLSRKESYKRAEVLNVLGCTNIVHAKALTNSLVSIETIDYWDVYKEEIISYWGYEFFPEEYKYPFRAGGWVTYNYAGVCLDLQVLDSLPFKTYVCRAVEACKHTNPKVYFKDKRPYNSPVIKILGNIKITPDVEGFLDVGSIAEMHSKYFQFRNNPARAEQAFDGLFKIRQRVFSKGSYEAQSFESFIDSYIDKSIDYYPLDFMIKSYCPVDHIKDKVSYDFYRSPNPILTALAKENPWVSEFKGETYSLLTKEQDSSIMPLSSSWIKLNEERLIYTFSLALEWKIEDVYPAPRNLDDDLEIQRSYINPKGITQTCNAMGENRIPILLEKYRSPYITEKESIFGFFIPLRNSFNIFNLKISREFLEDICHEIHDRELFCELLDDIQNEYNLELSKLISSEENLKVDESKEVEEPDPERVGVFYDIMSEDELDRLLSEHKASARITKLAFDDFRGIKLGNQSRMMWSSRRIERGYQIESDEVILDRVSVSWGLTPGEKEIIKLLLARLKREQEEAAEEEEDISQMFSDFLGDDGVG